MDPLSLVASTIAIVQATSSTYKAIQHLRGLPNEFKEVNLKLPLAQNTLSLLRQRLEGQASDGSANMIIRPLVKDCEEKAKELQVIFEKVAIGTKNLKDGSALNFYRTLLVPLGKGHRVETLMRSILKDLDALATNEWFEVDLQNQMGQLKEAIDGLSKLESSVPDSDFDGSRARFSQSIASDGTGYLSQYSGQGQYVNSGSGQQSHYSGQNQHINVGGGKQFNAQTMNFEVQTDEDHQRRRPILKSLYTLPYLDRKNRNPDRSPGTCEWFVNHSQFKQWRASRSSSMLWVSANPGCGKSVLAKYLVDELKTSELRITSYFFFKDDYDKQKSAIGALSCILHQLFIQREALFSNKILKRLEACRAQLGNSFDDLWDILLMAARDRNSGEIVCILDAFDECEEEERRKLGQTLRKFYDTANNEKNDISLKFLITSRPYDKIGRGFQPLDIPGLPIIHLRGESDEEMSKIAKEIDLYIKDKVSRIRKSRFLTPDEEQLLLQELRRIPNQTYLWVYLTLELLEHDLELDRTRIRKIVSSLPPTIDDVYEKILNKSDNFGKSKKLLHIIVAASRPLTVIEVDFALSIRPEHKSYKDWNQRTEERCGRYIRDLCGLFVNIIESKVYLLHQTAKEFLVQKEDPQPRGGQDNQLKWKASLRPAESHRILCEICIWHLRFSEFEIYPLRWGRVQDVSEYLRRYIFLEYSAINWASHFRASGIDHDVPIGSVRSLCYVSLTRCPTWFGVYWVNGHGRFPYGFTTLMIASYFGLKRLVHFLLAEKEDKINAIDGHDKRSALSWASENGFDDIVRLLTKRSISRLFSKTASVESKDRYGRTPLMYAAWNGHIATARRLIKIGARADSKDKIGGTPISYALCTGQETMANEFMKGTEVGSVAEIRQDLFQSAIQMRDEIFAKRLLENGANVNMKNQTGNSPLVIAVQLGSEPLAKLLLDYGADINTKNQTGDSPLSLAVGPVTGSLAKLLLDYGADINTKNQTGNSPLGLAVQLGSEPLAKLLLDYGADINTKNRAGDSPLGLAVQLRSKDLAKLLLDYGADINTKNRAGDSPLALAVGLGSGFLVHLLLGNGANANTKNNTGETPLILAVLRNRSEPFIKLLLEKGADPNARDNNGRSVVSIALNNRDIYRLLLYNGADPIWDPSPHDPDYVRPLIMAIQEQDYTLVKLLLDKGADPNVSDRIGRAALLHACKNGTIFKLLLSRGADPNGGINPRDLSDNWPLIRVIQRGDDARVRLLLDKGADPNVRDKNGRTAFSHARGNNTIIYLLVNAGAHHQPTVN